jgi:chromosome segregation ATPase
MQKTADTQQLKEMCRQLEEHSQQKHHCSQQAKSKNRDIQKIAEAKELERHIHLQCDEKIAELETQVRYLKNSIQVSSTHYFFLHCTSLQSCVVSFPVHVDVKFETYDENLL